MKKIGIIILVLGIAFSYSCKKDKKVQTSISGTLITNGTNDPIRLNTELPNPIVILFHVTFSSGGIIAGEDVATEVARTTIDNNANFSFDIDLYEDDEYFLGFSGLDKSKYYDMGEEWKGSQKFFPITPGISNTGVKIYVSAHSYIRPRFINTNPDPNNNDVFQYISGLPTNIVYVDPNQPTGSLIFHGLTDTILSSIHKTWSGDKIFGTNSLSNTHHVKGKLTRNGVTIDTIIPYFVPPFDTSIVEIRY